MNVELKPLYGYITPTTLEYRLHSRYWSRRHHKPHDFSLEVSIDFEFLFPDFVTCSQSGLSKYLRKKAILLKATYRGIEATIEVTSVDVINALRKKVEERGHPYSIRYLMRFLKDERNHIETELREYWGIPQRLARAIANDIINYLVNKEPFQVIGWDVEEESTLDPNQLYDSIETPFEEAYPVDYDNFIREVLIGIDDIVRGWFTEVLAWDYPVEGELAELDGGVSLLQDCRITNEPKNVLTSDWFEESFMITHVEYRKANAYDVEPTYIDYWSQSLREYLEEHSAEIRDLIWRAYVRNILRRVLTEVGLL